MRKIKAILLLSVMSFGTFCFAQDVNVGDTSAFATMQAQELYNAGIEKFNAKNLQGAMSDFNQAIVLLPNFDKAYFNRGSIKYQLGDFKEAIIDFNKVI